MSAQAAAGSLPPPDPGSTRYFVLLYCPRAQRCALATLLAVADEIGSGLQRQVDHAVAHARLEWWRQEAQRFSDGVPQHPWLLAWLRAQPADRALELEALVDAAALDLAHARLAGSSEGQLYGALFVLAAQLLAGKTLVGRYDQLLRALGQYTARREHASMPQPLSTPSTSAPRRQQAQATPPATTPPPPLQRRLAPLLVWSTLAERRAQRRARHSNSAAARSGPSRWATVADNLIAWRAARQAQRGRYRLDLSQR